MEAEKRNRIIDWSLFAVMLLAVSAVTLWLFYKQTTGSPELYHSDMKAYILEMQGLDRLQNVCPLERWNLTSWCPLQKKRRSTLP